MSVQVWEGDGIAPGQLVEPDNRQFAVWYSSAIGISPNYIRDDGAGCFSDADEDELCPLYPAEQAQALYRAVHDDMITTQNYGKLQLKEKTSDGLVWVHPGDLTRQNRC